MGEAKIFGKDAWKDAVEIHKRIAYVPGDVNLWPNLTGGEVIDLFVELRGTNNKSRREELIKKIRFGSFQEMWNIFKGKQAKGCFDCCFLI
ncbi:hypothetical protein RCO48_17640 [Peribacillus frigoritolerans]|nr:hypothetical protein [Peribacillus frigoritolerans]